MTHVIDGRAIAAIMNEQNRRVRREAARAG